MRTFSTLKFVCGFDLTGRPCANTIMRIYIYTHGHLQDFMFALAYRRQKRDVDNNLSVQVVVYRVATCIHSPVSMSFLTHAPQEAQRKDENGTIPAAHGTVGADAEASGGKHAASHEPVKTEAVGGQSSSSLLQSAEFVSRHEQLSFKKDKKGKRKNGKDTKAKAKGKKRGKKAKKAPRKGRKTRASASSSGQKSAGSSATRSKTSRKRQLLKRASSKLVEGDGEMHEEEVEEAPVESEAKKGRRGKGRKSAKVEPAHEMPLEPGQSEAEVEGVPKRKRGRQPAAKSKADSKTIKPKAAAKSKAKAKARATRSRRQSPIDDMLESPLRCNTVISGLIDWTQPFAPELDTPGHEEAVKKLVRSKLGPLKTCKLNIYWTRNACGVSVTEDGKKTKDINHFSWNGSTAAPRHKLAVAVRCAELAAP